MKITKENFEDFANMYEDLAERVETIMEIKLKGKREYLESFRIEGGQVSVTTTVSSNCSCCSDETEWHTISVDDLFADYEELKDKFEKEKEEEKNRREKKRKEDEEKRLKEKEAKEKAEFIRLNNKYGKL